jgi:hypothetical protein
MKQTTAKFALNKVNIFKETSLSSMSEPEMYAYCGICQAKKKVLKLDDNEWNIPICILECGHVTKA